MTAKGLAKVIAAGAIIIRAIMETLGKEECLVSDLGLREGVLIELTMRGSSTEGVMREELQAHANNLGKVLDEWLKISSLFLEDINSLVDTYQYDWSSQLFRRMFVRACWALIEGEVFCLKQFTLCACELGGKGLASAEHELLSEIRMLGDDSGRVKQEDVRERTHENLKQTLKLRPLSSSLDGYQTSAIKAGYS